MIPDSQEYYLAEGVETLLKRLRAIDSGNEQGVEIDTERETITITVPIFQWQELWTAYRDAYPSTTAHDIRNNVNPLQF